MYISLSFQPDQGLNIAIRLQKAAKEEEKAARAAEKAAEDAAVKAKQLQQEEENRYSSLLCSDTFCHVSN